MQGAEWSERLEELLCVSRAWDVFRPVKGQLEGIPGSER